MPPFFIPIFAFLLWASALFAYLPVFRLGLHLSNQLIAPLLFISCLILVLAWPLSGPLAAVVLSVLAGVISLYLMLAVKEPALFLQLFIYAALFIFMVSYLHRIQKATNDKGLLREKTSEDIHLIDEAIHRKELLKHALEDKIERLLDLRQFSDQLKTSTDTGEVARRVVQEAYSALRKADECVLYLVDRARQELSLVASTKPAGEVVKEKAGSLFDQWVLKKAQAIMVEDTQNDFRFPKESVAALSRLRSVCVSPLLSQNKVLGVVRVSSAIPEAFNLDDLRLLDIFANLGSVRLRNILLYETMGELAIQDSLTGLYLNRYFQERLAEEIQRALMDKSRFSLVLLDIDYFKQFNDDYGHAAGDIVLKNIASILQRCVEPVDFVARYGGEEFVVLLPNKKKREAMKFAETLRAEIEKEKFMVRRQEARVTASFGVVTFPDGGRTREELIWTVDRNLYEAKRTGRNRVCGNS